MKINVWEVLARTGKEVPREDIKKLNCSLNKVLLTMEIGESFVTIKNGGNGKYEINTGMETFQEDEIESITLVKREGSLPQLIIKLEEFEILHTTY